MDHLFLLLLIGHWFGDFVFQSDSMSKNKSKSWVALSEHVGIYTMTLGGTLIIGNFLLISSTLLWTSFLWFVAITFVAHFITDAITSRINSKLWAAGRVHDFFVSIGFDQLLHFIQLYFTARWVLTGSLF